MSEWATDPWTGAAKYVKVRDREEVGVVLVSLVNIGNGDRNVECYALLFESTGQVVHYARSACIRCDAGGNESRPNE
jgi:hypothetical protein